MPVCGNCQTRFEASADGLCPNCRVALPKSEPEPAATAPTPAPADAPPAAKPLAFRKAPEPSGGTLRWVLLGALGLVVFAVLLAESGVVAADAADTNWTAEGRYEFQSSTAGRGRPPLRGVTFTPTVTVATTGGRDLANAAADVIKKSATGGAGGGGSKLEIRITQVTPEGATWVPFYKSGSCTFVAEYTLSAETPWSSFAGRGQVSGKVTQTMTGLCSTGQYRDKMGQAIAQAILSDVAKLVAKHS